MTVWLFLVQVPTTCTEYFSAFLKIKVLDPKVTSESRENTKVLPGSDCVEQSWEGFWGRVWIHPEGVQWWVRDTCPGYVNREEQHTSIYLPSLILFESLNLYRWWNWGPERQTGLFKVTEWIFFQRARNYVHIIIRPFVWTREAHTNMSS